MSDNIGIFALECYFPKLYVDQQDLEVHDGCVGKYTKGLGLKQMGVCSPYEDTASQALTATKMLLKNYNIDINRIGRIDCGTESIIDKSKSIKSNLMQLFEHSNSFIEGADSINACYGGTAAFFNACAWVDSSFNHENKFALVVATDQAIYDPNGSPGARATGGAGAVALLVGRGAPHIVINPKWRASYSRHVWDFYKPDMTVPFPTVDAGLTLVCYMEALDRCCGQLVQHVENKSLLDGFDYFIFHSPFYKMVEKAFARLYKNDTSGCYVTRQNDENNNNEWTKSVERQWMANAKDCFVKKVHPSLTFSERIGNMYTPSVYASLISLISQLPDVETAGHSKNVTVFSYGSGLVSSIFGLTIHNSPQNMLSESEKDIYSLRTLKANFQRAILRMDSRVKISPEQFIQQISVRRQRPNEYKTPTPEEVKNSIFEGAYYLSNIDEHFRRTYEQNLLA